MALKVPRFFRREIWPTLGYFAAMALLLVSERVLGEPGLPRTVLRISAIILGSLAVSTRVGRTVHRFGMARRFELYLTGGYLAGGAALVFGALLDHPLAASLWPALWLGSALAIAFMEISAASSLPGEPASDGRIGAALQSAVETVLVLVSVVAINYLGAKTDKRVDLSFLQETRPSVTMRQIVSRLKEPVEVRIFYPQRHEVRARLLGYFEQLRGAGSQLDVAFLDEAIDHAAAMRYGAQGNGAVVVAKENRQIPISVGMDWDYAKRQLEDFDSQLQWAVNKVARSRKLYFVTGHGEADSGRDSERLSGPTIDNPLKGIELHTRFQGPDSTRTFIELHKLLRAQGYDLEQLVTRGGLISPVPADAAVLFLVAPSTPLFPEEVAELRGYLERGGRLFIFLDPDSSTNLQEFLSEYRLRFVPRVLVNEYVHLQRTAQASDRTNLVTNSFSTHPAVMTVSRQSNAYRILFGRAGYLEEIPPSGERHSAIVYFLMHAHPQTFADLNGNFAFDPPAEIRRPYELAAAVAGPSKLSNQREFRMLVYADVDIISDSLIANPGNQQAILDALAYVGMDEPIPYTVSMSDPLIRHTQQQDKAWFYSVSFGVPVLVLLGGLAGSRRSRNRTR